VIAIGAGGGVESCVKLTESEQSEVFPAASVAVAAYDVLALEGVVTAKPDAKLEALPVSTGLPVQVELA
jgi:hypothetical protein